MDRLAFILDLHQSEDLLLQKFEDHSKYVHTSIQFMQLNILYTCTCRYVVRVLWSTSGTFFITASYDKTICVYR